jgi:hypothetical protein
LLKSDVILGLGSEGTLDSGASRDGLNLMLEFYSSKFESYFNVMGMYDDDSDYNNDDDDNDNDEGRPRLFDPFPPHNG